MLLAELVTPELRLYISFHFLSTSASTRFGTSLRSYSSGDFSASTPIDDKYGCPEKVGDRRGWSMWFVALTKPRKGISLSREIISGKTSLASVFVRGRIPEVSGPFNSKNYPHRRSFTALYTDCTRGNRRGYYYRRTANRDFID